MATRERAQTPVLAKEDPYLQYLNDKFRFPRSLVHRPIQKFFADELSSLEDGSRVLDAGCGNGVETGPYAERLEVHGVDYQPSYIAVCRERYPRGHFQVEELSSLSFEDDHFDLVVMNQVIEHLEAPEAVVAELARVLRPGGRILVSTPNYGTFAWPLVESTYHRWFVGEFDAESNHVTHYDPVVLGAHMSAGLRVEHIDTVCLGMILVASARKAR